MGDAHLRRPLLGGRVQRAVPAQPGQGPDRAVGRLRPADPDRLRPRRRAGPRRGRQGRRAGQPPRRHARAVRRHPARRDEHLDDHQRHRDVAARALRGRGAEAGRVEPSTRRDACARLAGTTQNDIIKEYLSRGTYVFPPAAVAAADHRHDRLHRHRTSRSGTRSTSAATTCRRPARRRCRSSRSRMCTAIAVLDAVRDSGQVPPERFGEVVARISFFVNAGVRFVEEMCKMRAFVAAVGRAHPRALRRRPTPSSAGSATACR